ncbi:MAG: hypothetical protein WC755_03090 [Candidatus Woesearchaeota archaeon]|jgi:hypothetical protein
MSPAVSLLESNKLILALEEIGFLHPDENFLYQYVNSSNDNFSARTFLAKYMLENNMIKGLVSSKEKNLSNIVADNLLISSIVKYSLSRKSKMEMYLGNKGVIVGIARGDIAFKEGFDSYLNISNVIRTTRPYSCYIVKVFD